jgi:hypothetical protein
VIRIFSIYGDNKHYRIPAYGEMENFSERDHIGKYTRI